jgi:predicted anti-sigma-YlaC factor YlaD
MNQHPHELLGAYADGELDAAQTAQVAQHLTKCTECARELALIRSMGGAMRTLVNSTESRGIWETVHRRLSRPIGWLLMLAGVAVWTTLAVVEWYRSRELTWEWMAGSAVVIGVVLLAVGIGYEQYREWKETRYRDVMR